MLPSSLVRDRWQRLVIGWVFALAVALGIVTPTPSRAQAEAQAYVSNVELYQTARSYVADPSQLSDRGYSINTWEPWLDASLMTPDMRARPFKAWTHIILDVDPAGKVKTCSVAKSAVAAALERAACARLIERATLPLRYEAPMVPVGWRGNFAFAWTTVTRAKANADAYPPVGLPRRSEPEEYTAWPRLKYNPALDVERFADLSSYLPKGKMPRAVTSVDVMITPDKGVASCTVGVPSGEALLDTAACDAAKAMRFRYQKICDQCGEIRLPLQFVWDGRNSHVRVPLLDPESEATTATPMRKDPKDKRSATHFSSTLRVVNGPLPSSEWTKINAGEETRLGSLVTFQIDGVGKITRCSMVILSGSPGTEAALCKLMQEKIGFASRTDVFGNDTPLPASQRHIANLTDLFQFR